MGMTRTKTHFGGLLQWLRGRELTIILAGHAACGRQSGRSTREASNVTCRLCRSLMQKSEARLAWSDDTVRSRLRRQGVATT